MNHAVVTGASRGMGLVVSLELARRGWTVFAGARRPDDLKPRLVELQEQEGQFLDIRPVGLDVTSDASVQAAVTTIADQTGHVDVVVNNAGVPGTWATAEDVGPDDFEAVLQTNVLGPVRVSRAFLPLLRESAKPRLVFVSSGMGSIASQTTDPAFQDIAHVPYPASKAALNMIAVQYAKALPDIIVTTVDPGLTATEFTAGSGHSVEAGAAPILTAALDVQGPSGRFMNGTGLAVW
jgi:NAD(P)-dependent dehydrogenase (short-subunit alcohol dehydrogenase family)